MRTRDLNDYQQKNLQQTINHKPITMITYHMYTENNKRKQQTRNNQQ